MPFLKLRIYKKKFEKNQKKLVTITIVTIYCMLVIRDTIYYQSARVLSQLSVGAVASVHVMAPQAVATDWPSFIAPELDIFIVPSFNIAYQASHV